MTKLKKYNHSDENFWVGCGFENKAMEDMFTDMLPTLKKLDMPSKMVEHIEGLKISEREKMCLCFYLAGFLSTNKFNKALQERDALANKAVGMLQKEIVRLGGSLDKNEFGKIQPRKKK